MGSTVCHSSDYHVQVTPFSLRSPCSQILFRLYCCAMFALLSVSLCKVQCLIRPAVSCQGRALVGRRIAVSGGESAEDVP